MSGTRGTQGGRAVGARVLRRDSQAKVTGTAIYTDDMVLPGMLHGVILRCPHPRARIVSIDTSKARSVSGVKAVMTAMDTPWLDTEVSYPGQRIGGIAATNPYAAALAAKEIEVEYQILPAVTDLREAFSSDAPEVAPSRSHRYNNVAAETIFERGDPAGGFEQADIIVENEYEFPAGHHAYMEPHCCIARYGTSDKLEVWTGVQGQFGARSELASIFRLPVNQVEVTAPEVGGAFGGKTNLIAEPICSELARRAGAPVKILMDRREELADSRPGPAAVMTVKTGATSDGLIVAETATLMYDTGCKPGASSGTVDRCRGLYTIPNFAYESYSIYTNKLVPGSYRAPGAIEMTFAFESQLDIIAERIGMDPLELRLKNGVRKGEKTIAGPAYPEIGFIEVVNQAKGYMDTLKPAPNVGVGVACGKWMNAVGASAAILSLNEDGTITVTTGAVDLTGVNTVLAQVVADTMQISVDAVLVDTKGTGSVPYVALSGGSRTTYGMSLAVRDGAEKLIADLVAFAHKHLATDGDRVSYSGGSIVVGEQTMSIGEVAQRAFWSPSGPISATGSAANDTWLTDSHIFIAQVAEVLVDPDTGTVGHAKISSFQDVGFAMNPTLVEAQIEGGIVQGYGWGMYEGLRFHDGVVINDSFIEYKVPTSLDAPDAIPRPVEIASPSGLFGMKGVGEPAMVAIPAAVANAISSAIGKRLTRAPLSASEIQ